MKTLTLCLLAGILTFAQVAKDANEGYRSADSRKNVANTLTGESRDRRQKPEELIKAARVEPGMTVADIGTGAGYMLPWLSAAVGPSGTVYAEDIFPDFLDTARKHAAKHTNVKYILGNEKSAELPVNSVDVMLVLDAYHHFDYPEAMLASLRSALKPEGRLVMVEYHKNEKSMENGRALKHIRATRDEFVKELEANGFQSTEVREFIPDVQWMAVFVRK